MQPCDGEVSDWLRANEKPRGPWIQGCWLAKASGGAREGSSPFGRRMHLAVNTAGQLTSQRKMLLCG